MFVRKKTIDFLNIHSVLYSTLDNLYTLLTAGVSLRIHSLSVLRPCLVFILAPYYFPGWSPFSTTFFTYHTRILEEFARDNDFEVFDVPADGNCMFCSVEDQLRINAQFGETAKSLRERAVRYCVQ